MKKITLVLAFIGMIMLQGCTVNENTDTIDNDTISEVWEYNVNVNFLFSNNYTRTLVFPRPIFNSDMVLVYRLSGIFQGQDVWKLLPETYFFPDGTLNFRYDFDFTTTEAVVFLEGFDLEGISLAFRTNQVIRVVVVPGFFGKTAQTVDLNDYNAVVQAYNIDDSKVKLLN
jgi:hypothetical protein